MNTVNEETFVFRVFSSERPKTLASKSKDTVDPALEYTFPKEFHSSSVLSHTEKQIILFCYGGQDKENPQTNYNQSIMILRFSIDETNTIYQEETLFAKSFPPHTVNQAKCHVKRSSFPDLTMSATSSCKKSIWMFGGFDLRFDENSNELYCFSNIKFVKDNSEAELFCQHFPGQETLKMLEFHMTNKVG